MGQTERLAFGLQSTPLGNTRQWYLQAGTLIDMGRVIINKHKNSSDQIHMHYA